MIPDILQGIFQSIASVFFATWWIVVPLGLAFLFWDYWKLYVYINYLKSIKWVLLELKVPPNIEKTPKAMEQVFAAVYGLYSHGFNFVQKYWEGHLAEDFISFELVGFAGGVHFYVRTPASFRNAVEAAIYGQYPDAEVIEAQDYMDLMPRTLPNQVYDIFGMDYHLIRENAYPIRTYEYFEASQEEQRLDPISAVTEVMSKLKEDEALWVQIFVRPTGQEWKKEAEVIRDKLIGRKPPAKPPGPFGAIFQFIRNLIIAPIEHPIWPEAKKDEEKSRLLMMSPGERDVVEALENKIGKLGFETNIRFIYIDKKESFTRLNVAAMISTFNQFNTQNLNGFRPNVDTMTIIRGNIKWFKNRRLWLRKRLLFDDYRKRRWPRRKSILNTEELATLYHFPSLVVEAPLLRKLGAKKGEPPAGLPVE